MPSYTELKDVSQANDSLMSDQLEANLTSFFQWGFLGVGGFFNVVIPTSGAYGGNQHQLRLSEDPNYLPGQVWEGFRKDWVWETGVPYSTQPVRVSGVYVNGNFQPATGVGPYEFSVNYPMGQVVFNAPISTGSLVTCEYSYRQHQWYTADSPWWQEVQLDSYRVDDPMFLQYGSGAWSVLADHRVQLPAVVVEATPKTQRWGKQIGDLSQIVRQDVLFHILAETNFDRKTLHDVITYQWQHRILGYDKNLVLASGWYPLNPDGSPQPSGLQYPDLVMNAFWEQIRFMGMASQDHRRFGPVYYSTVRLTAEVDIH